MKGGFGTAAKDIVLESGERLIVGAVAVTNCVGDILNEDGSVLAGARSSDEAWFAENDPLQHLVKEPEIPEGTNTTLIVAASNAARSVK